MPEGPNIFILKELLHQFINKKVLKAHGQAKLDFTRIENKIIKDIRCWGKHLLICFNNFTIKVHLQLFGTYTINYKKSTPPRLSLLFTNGNVDFYGCSVQYLEDDLNKIYDWTSDIMSDKWDSQKALKKLQIKNNMLLCDALLDQNIFSGVGNIIKNEVLYRTKVHPKNKIQNLPKEKLEEIIEEAKSFTFRYLNWEKLDELDKNLLVYSRKICENEHKLVKEDLGKFKRKNYHCEVCQIIFNNQNA